MSLRRTAGIAVAAVALALWLGAGAGPGHASGRTLGAAGAPATISGASQAVCSPAPCAEPSSATTYTLPGVSNDDGTTTTRQYEVFRPERLKASPANLAPAVLVFYASGNCGPGFPFRFQELSATDRFVAVEMEVPCGRAKQAWEERNISTPGTRTPNDEPYVASVVSALTRCPASGAGPGQCIDPRRIYAAGLSSGGHMAADIMCDVQNSPLFRGYLIDSSALFGSPPHCPSTNRSYYAMMAVGNQGIDQSLYYNNPANPHLDPPAFADWMAARLGCTSPRVDSTFGAPVSSNQIYTYDAPCAYAVSGAAVQSIAVINGAHGFGCQDSDPGAPPGSCTSMPNPPGLTPGGLPKTNGMYVEAAFMNFVAQGVSSATPASPLVDTTPPTVSLTAPAAGAVVKGTVPLAAEALDVLGVEDVQFTVDRAGVGGPITTEDSSGVFSGSWDTTAWSDGPHVVRATARDPSGNTATTAGTVVTVANPLSRARGAAWVALGDGFASGAGLGQYLHGTDVRGDRCQRSTLSYPFLVANRLGVPAGRFAFHACSGTGISELYRANRHDHEPSQLTWPGARTAVAILSTGWRDSGLAAALSACGHGRRSCAGGRVRAVTRALSALRSRRGSLSLYRLLRRLKALSPRARILAVGYPRLFPARAPASCSVAPGLRFSRASMSWLDGRIGELDRIVRAAARAAGVRYVDAFGALGGHELCTGQPDVTPSLGLGAAGQAALAAIVARAA